jgi:hypothetical protein
MCIIFCVHIPLPPELKGMGIIFCLHIPLTPELKGMGIIFCAVAASSPLQVQRHLGAIYRIHP